MFAESVRRLRDDPRALLAVACGFALIPLGVAKYLPMTDLPQHTAQIAIWKHLDDPSFGFADQFALNWQAPYLLGYLLCRLLAAVVSVPVAVKVVVGLAVLALPWSVDRLLARTGGDRSWAIACLPLGFGFAFQWGFLNYMIAAPIGIYLVARGIQQIERPSARGAVALGALSVLLYFAHLAVFAFCAGVVVAMICVAARTPRWAILNSLPLLAPLPAAIVWTASANGPNSALPTVWDLSWLRSVELFWLMFGTQTDGLAALFAVSVVACVVWGARLDRRRWRWVPGFAAVASFGFGPSFAVATALVYQRFAVLVLPMVLVALSPIGEARRAARARLALLAIVLVWIGVLGWRFRGFDGEAREIEPLIAEMQPKKRVMGLVIDPLSAYVPHTPFDHFAAWYQVERGGTLVYTFAFFPVAVARDTTGRTETSLAKAEFDYLLVRSLGDPSERIIAGRGQAGALLARSGAWWLFSASGNGRP